MITLSFIDKVQSLDLTELILDSVCWAYKTETAGKL